MQNRIPNETPAGWLARVVGAVVGAIVMVALFFLGVTVFAAVAGLAIVVFLVLAVRVWWLRRKLRRGAARNERTPHQGARHGVTLEGEYEEQRQRRNE